MWKEMLGMNKNSTEEYLFRDQFQGVEKGRALGGTRFLVARYLGLGVYGSLVLAAFAIIVTGFPSEPVVYIMCALLSLLFLLNLKYPTSSRHHGILPVCVTENGIWTGYESRDPVPFQQISGVYECGADEEYSHFSLEFHEKEDEIRSVSLHVKDGKGFLKALRAVVGEEYWQEIFISQEEIWARRAKRNLINTFQKYSLLEDKKGIRYCPACDIALELEVIACPVCQLDISRIRVIDEET